jgi:hypothetical protein
MIFGALLPSVVRAEIGYDKESGSFEFADGLVWRTIPNIIWMVTHNEAEITREQFSLLALELGYRCYTVAEITIRTGGFSEEYWSKVKTNAEENIYESSAALGWSEQMLQKHANEHIPFFHARYMEAWREAPGDTGNDFLVDEMGDCSAFFGKVWGK